MRSAMTRAWERLSNRRSFSLSTSAPASIRAAGVAGAELEDLTSLPRSIEGVEVGLTLRQQKDGSFKISVRTGHDTNACNIARRLGGGGHPRAAGCEISGNPDNAKHAILEEVKKELDRADAEKEAQ